jgi:hypothetical protein
MARSIRHSMALDTRVTFDTRDGKTIRYKDDCGVIAAGVLFSAHHEAWISYRKLAQDMVNRGIYSDGGSHCGKLITYVRNNVAPNSRKFWHDEKKSVSEYLLPRPKWTGLLLVHVEDGYHAIAVVDGVVFNGVGYEDASIMFSLKTK